MTPRRSQHPKTHPHEMNIVEAENKKLQDESHELKTLREEVEQLRGEDSDDATNLSG